MLLYFQHVQPIHDHHRLDQISPQIYMHPIVHVRLDTHVPCPKVFYAPSCGFCFHRLFKQHECFVTLADDPLIGLGFPGCVGRYDQSWPQGVWLREVGKSRGGQGQDMIEPVEGRLEVEIIPKAVAEDEGIWFLRLGAAEERREALRLLRWNGESDHQLDYVSFVSFIRLFDHSKKDRG